LLDAGQFGSQRFVVMASAGFDAAVIQEVHHRRRGHLSRWTYIPSIWRVLTGYQYPEIRVWIDDRPEPLLARQVVIVNLPLYALGIRMARTALDDDQQFDLRLFQRGSSWQMWRYFFHLWFGTHERLPDVLSIKAQRIRLESDIPIPMQVDGDPAGMTPQTFEVVPASLRVLWPRGVPR